MDVAADAGPARPWSPTRRCAAARTRSATAAGTATRWRSHDIAPAGETLFSYHNAGITLDHADPSRLVLSRTIGGQNEIEERHTTDHGATWSSAQLTHDSPSFNIRPVIPRGAAPGGRRVVLYVSGHARSFREYDTSVMMGIDDR